MRILLLNQAPKTPSRGPAYDVEAIEKLVNSYASAGTRIEIGFPDDFEFAQDLRRKNFVALRAIDDEVMTGPRLLKALETDLNGLAPFTDYLCAALDLEF